jgi:hypothetical protein
VSDPEYKRALRSLRYTYARWAYLALRTGGLKELAIYRVLKLLMIACSDNTIDLQALNKLAFKVLRSSRRPGAAHPMLCTQRTESPEAMELICNVVQGAIMLESEKAPGAIVASALENSFRMHLPGKIGDTFFLDACNQFNEQRTRLPNDIEELTEAVVRIGLRIIGFTEVRVQSFFSYRDKRSKRKK